MTPEQQKAIADYIGFLMPILELADWRVNVSVLSATEGTQAEIKATEGQKYATLWIGADFFAQSLFDMKQTLIHEMCHLLSRDQGEILKQSLPELLGLPAYSVLWKAYDAADEIMTDTLAYAFGDLISGDEDLLQALEAAR